jgi:hypothetical protein
MDAAVQATGLTPLAAYSLLVGFLLPLVIALFQQPRFPRSARLGITFGMCIVAGSLTVWLTPAEANGRNLIGSILTIALAAVSFYDKVWKPTAARIEAATSPGATVIDVPVMQPKAAIVGPSAVSRDAGGGATAV